MAQVGGSPIDVRKRPTCSRTRGVAALVPRKIKALGHFQATRMGQFDDQMTEEFWRDCGEEHPGSDQRRLEIL